MLDLWSEEKRDRVDNCQGKMVNELYDFEGVYLEGSIFVDQEVDSKHDAYFRGINQLLAIQT